MAKNKGGAFRLPLALVKLFRVKSPQDPADRVFYERNRFLI